MSAATEAFALLEKGNVIEGPQLLAGLSNDAVTAEVLGASNQGVKTVAFSFMGVRLATAAGKVQSGKDGADDKISWTEVK